MQELSAEKAKNVERNNGAGDDSLQRFAVANQDKRFGKTSVKQPKIILPQSIISRRHEINISKVVQIEWRNRLSQAHARKQPPVRNHDKLGQSHKWTSENRQNDAAAKAGAVGEPVESCSKYSRRIQHDTNAST